MSALLRALLILIGHVPLPVLHACASLFGRLAWYVPNNLKRVTRLHLDLCMGELPLPERERIARLSLVHMAKAVIEAPAIWYGPEARLRGWIDDRAARQTLRNLVAEGRGVIILCPHIGSWELAGMFCSEVGPITTLYKPQGPIIDPVILEGRVRLGAHLVPTTGSGVKSLLQALKSGQMAGILPDQDPPWGAGVFAPLFGRPAHTPELVTRLAARTGAAVWFCYAERLPLGVGFRIHVAPAPQQIDKLDQGATALNQGIESVLMHLPEQYWWSYKRFRRQPAGSLNPYARLRR